MPEGITENGGYMHGLYRLGGHVCIYDENIIGLLEGAG